MKQRLLLGLMAMCTVSAGWAQPTINQNSYGPVPGDHFASYSVGTSPMPEEGMNMIWDYTGLVLQGEPGMQLTYYAPLLDDPDQATVYSKSGSSTSRALSMVNATGIYYLGTDYGNLGQEACIQPRLTMPFPFTSGSYRTQDYSCAMVFAGSSSSSSGTIECSAPGYGTLQLPYGDVGNVLLVKSALAHQLVSSSGTTNSTAMVYTFVKPGLHHPVLTIRTDSSSTGDVHHFTFVLDGEAVGIQEAMAQAIGMELYPNPAVGSVELACGTLAAGPASVEIVDPMGRAVQLHTLRAGAPGLYRETLDLAGLAAGLYTVRVTDAQGATGAKRLVVR